MSINIVGMEGQILKSFPIQKKEDQKVIFVEDLKDGAYIVLIKDGGKEPLSQKIVIIR